MEGKATSLLHTLLAAGELQASIGNLVSRWTKAARSPDFSLLCLRSHVILVTM